MEFPAGEQRFRNERPGQLNLKHLDSVRLFLRMIITLPLSSTMSLSSLYHAPLLLTFACWKIISPVFATDMRRIALCPPQPHTRLCDDINKPLAHFKLLWIQFQICLIFLSVFATFVKAESFLLRIVLLVRYCSDQP